eukprot:s1727_g7.t1
MALLHSGKWGGDIVRNSSAAERPLPHAAVTRPGSRISWGDICKSQAKWSQFALSFAATCQTWRINNSSMPPGETGRRPVLRRVTRPERAIPPELLTPEAMTRRMISGLDRMTHIRGSLDSIKRLHENLCTYAEQQVQLQNTMIDAIENLGAAMGVFNRAGIPEVATAPGHVGPVPVPVPGQVLPGAVYANPSIHVPQPLMRSTASASIPTPTIRMRGWPSLPYPPAPH